MRYASMLALAVCLSLPAQAQEAPVDPFTQMLADVYANHPRIKVERESLEILDARVIQATADFLPTANASYSKGRERQRLVEGTDMQYNDSHMKRLDVRQPLFQGARQISNNQAARREYKAGEARLASVEQQVLMESIRAYAELVYRRQALDIIRRNERALAEQAEGTRIRRENNDTTRTDEAQSGSRHAHARARVRQAEAELARAEAGFERVTTLSPASVPATLHEQEFPLPKTLEEARAQALVANPDIIAAGFSEEAADKRIGVEVSRLAPDVGIEGTMIRSEGGSQTGLSMFDNDEVRLNVRIPIFQGGAEYGRISEARHSYRRARNNALDTRQEVLRDVTSVWNDYQLSGAVLQAAKEAAAAAEEASGGMRIEQREGQRSVLDTLDTEQDMLNRELDYAQALRDRFIARYELLATLGQLTTRAVPGRNTAS